MDCRQNPKAGPTRRMAKWPALVGTQALVAIKSSGEFASGKGDRRGDYAQYDVARPHWRDSFVGCSELIPAAPIDGRGSVPVNPGFRLQAAAPANS